jgi:hypothetical protein
MIDLLEYGIIDGLFTCFDCKEKLGCKKEIDRKQRACLQFTPKLGTNLELYKEIMDDNDYETTFKNESR